MAKAANVYDVAAAAGVSTATVSRYFRSPDKLREETREAVRSAVERLGYLPSGMARGLAERHAGAVGLYSFSGHEPDELEMPAPADPEAIGGSADGVRRVREGSGRPRLYPLFADEVLRGAELECTVRGLPLVVGWQRAQQGGTELDEIARRVDGVVVLPSIVDDAALAQLARRTPVVLVAQPGPPEVSAVLVDNRGGMRAAADHLVVDHGARTFWFAGPEEGFEHEGRRRGFDESLAAHGLPAAGPSVVPEGSRGAARDALAAALPTALAAGALPDAILCSSDQTALGVMEALAEAGIQVPGDVRVTGFDGIDAGRFQRPALTTVRQPMDALGRVAMALLVERIGDPSLAPRRVVMPVELVLRESCGCAPG